MKLGVIVNPTAGSGSARRRLPEILAALERAGLEGRVFETKGPGHARELLGQARELGLECVAVVGGDGTLNEVALGRWLVGGARLAAPGSFLRSPRSHTATAATAAAGRSLRMRDVDHQAATSDVSAAQRDDRRVGSFCRSERDEAEAAQATVGTSRQVHTNDGTCSVVIEQLHDLLLRHVVRQVADVERAIFAR